MGALVTADTSTKSPHAATVKQGIGVPWWQVRWFEFGRLKIVRFV
jgi:hypothetical protein